MKKSDPIIQVNKRQCRHWTLFAVLSLFCFSAQAQSEAEYRIKAVFLYNFTQFVEWPANAFSSQHDPFIIGILGDDPFGNNLKEAVSGEKGNGHFILVRKYNHISEIRKCHILFINRDDTTDMDLLNYLARTQHTLLVSDDSSEFLEKGGMIRFVNRNNRIHLQINLTAIKAANLAISSKMLRLAELVK
jgi:hypothetical protein